MLITESSHKKQKSLPELNAQLQHTKNSGKGNNTLNWRWHESCQKMFLKSCIVSFKFLLIMLVSTFDVTTCVKPSHHDMAAERNKRRSGKLFVAGGLDLTRCKSPLTEKALSNLNFQKMKWEEHIVSYLFGYTGPIAKWRLCPSYVVFISNKVAIDGVWTVGIPCNGDVWTYLVVLLSLHTNRNKLKGSEEFNWKSL